MTEPLVSILTPVYNGERFLDAAVNSVCHQSYANWELLLVDDGSKDGSWRLIEDWAARDTRIRAFAHPDHANHGVGATRNLALRHAVGKYVALLDCDDEWLPDKLRKQVAVIEANTDVVMIYSKAVSIDEAGLDLSLSQDKFDFPLICGTGIPGKSINVFGEMIRDTIWMPPLTVMMYIDSVKTLGGFDETLVYQVEDHLLFTLLSEKSAVFFIDEILAKYRVHSSSYTQMTPWLYSMIEYYAKLYEKLTISSRPLVVSAKSQFIVTKLLRQGSSVFWWRDSKLREIVCGHIADPRVDALEKARFIRQFVIAWLQGLLSSAVEARR